MNSVVETSTAPTATVRAYRSGYSAAVANMGLDENPFPCGALHAAWIDGWRTAVAESVPVGEDGCGDCRQPFLACTCKPGE